MKLKAYTIFLFALVLSSCNDWLTQQDATALSTTQAYSSVSGISSIAANLYSRLRYEQDFVTDANSYDLTRWDEAINNSDYWAFATNSNQDYRAYYDYSLIRDINQHIYCLKNDVGSGVSAEKQRYFLAEARYMPAIPRRILREKVMCVRPECKNFRGIKTITLFSVSRFLRRFRLKNPRVQSDTSGWFFPPGK